MQTPAGDDAANDGLRPLDFEQMRKYRSQVARCSNPAKYVKFEETRKVLEGRNGSGDRASDMVRWGRKN